MLPVSAYLQSAFKAPGIVMDVFLLYPDAHLLAGFVWISRSNSKGLYMLLDWDKEERNASRHVKLVMCPT